MKSPEQTKFHFVLRKRFTPNRLKARRNEKWFAQNELVKVNFCINHPQWNIHKWTGIVSNVSFPFIAILFSSFVLFHSLTPFLSLSFCFILAFRRILDKWTKKKHYCTKCEMRKLSPIAISDIWTLKSQIKSRRMWNWLAKNEWNDHWWCCVAVWKRRNWIHLSSFTSMSTNALSTYEIWNTPERERAKNTSANKLN